MLIQLQVEDSQSEFFIDLISKLDNVVNNITYIEQDKIIQNSNEYFEVTDDNGLCHNIPNWKDGEFERMGLESFFKDEEKITAEELFDV